MEVARPASGRGTATWWRCVCDCGGETVIPSTSWGRTQSCGCLRRRSGENSPFADLRPMAERLAEKSYTDLTTGCLVWTGLRLHFGHGVLSRAGQHILVHRAAWEESKGPISDGLDCLHHCDNPPCWNVDHLFLGTQADNNADRDRKGRHVPSLGEAHGMAILTESQVRAILEDQRPRKEIAESFGVSVNIHMIKGRKTWRHIA